MDDDGAPQAPADQPAEIAGLLRRRPDRMWGGPGSGATCAACGERIAPDDAELELEFSGPDLRSAAIRVHTRCFHALQAESRAADALKQGRDPGTLLASGRATSDGPGSE